MTAVSTISKSDKCKFFISFHNFISSLSLSNSAENIASKSSNVTSKDFVGSLKYLTLVSSNIEAVSLLQIYFA